MERRPARKQQLPADEAGILNALWDDELYTRVRSLYEAGWTLQAIGNAFSPPRTRSTVRFWVNRRHSPEPLKQILPLPKYKARGYVSRRPKSPGIDSVTLLRIQEISPLARRYRAKMSPSSEEARANDELTSVCVSLINDNVTVRELAAAAGVTYRAMARRLGR
jgi:hypothetical protein